MALPAASAWYSVNARWWAKIIALVGRGVEVIVMHGLLGDLLCPGEGEIPQVTQSGRQPCNAHQQDIARPGSRCHNPNLQADCPDKAVVVRENDRMQQVEPVADAFVGATPGCVCLMGPIVGTRVLLSPSCHRRPEASPRSRWLRRPPRPAR